MRRIILVCLCVLLSQFTLSTAQDDGFTLPELIPITAENVGQIVQLTSLGYGDILSMAWSVDGHWLGDANRALELDPEYGRAYGLRGVIAYVRWQDTGQETFRMAAHADLTTYIDLIGDAARPDYLAIYEQLNE